MSCGISSQVFGLTLFFLSNRQVHMVLNGKSFQGYHIKAGVRQGSVLGPTFFLLYINDFPDDIICNIAMYADATTFYS